MELETKEIIKPYQSLRDLSNLSTHTFAKTVVCAVPRHLALVCIHYPYQIYFSTYSRGKHVQYQ